MDLRAHQDVEPSLGPEGKQSYINTWLEKQPSTRANSCPPQLAPDCTPALDPGEGQRPLLDVLQEMSHPEIQRLRRGSVTSSRNSQSPTSHPDYRSILYGNGVRIDDTGSKMPRELREFVELEILKERSPPLSAEAIAEAVNMAVELANSPEGTLHHLVGTAVLPIKHSYVGRGSGTPWCTFGLPRKDTYVNPLAQPKPDLHCGYPAGGRSTWTVEEMAVIDHAQARPATQPARGNCLPFLIVEMKSEAMGRTLWQAENQVAGGGACCVNGMRWLFREAYSSKEPPVVDSIAFSACVSHRLVVVHVHHYSVEDDLYHMSSIGSFSTTREVQKCNSVIRNILDYGLGTRQRKVRDAVRQLYPFPEHWKQIQCASFMESQTLDTDEE